MTLDDLKKFSADKDDPHWYIREPWTRDGYTYATNGHILVCVPAVAYALENDRAPDIAALMAKQAEPTAWLPVPEVMTPALEECPGCHGDKVCLCSRCDSEHDCGRCSGAGEVEPKPNPVAVGNAYFADKYLALIQGWEIAPNGNEAAWIRNGEAIGLLMPRRGP